MCFVSILSVDTLQVSKLSSECERFNQYLELVSKNRKTSPRPQGSDLLGAGGADAQEGRGAGL